MKRCIFPSILNCWYLCTRTLFFCPFHIYYLLLYILAKWSVFANGPGDRSSIPGQVIPRTQKMVLDTSFRIKHKWSNQGKGVAASLLSKRKPSGCPQLRSANLLIYLVLLIGKELSIFLSSLQTNPSDGKHSIYSWVNSGTDYVHLPCLATSLREEKFWIQTNLDLFLKMALCHIWPLTVRLDKWYFLKIFSINFAFHLKLKN